MQSSSIHTCLHNAVPLVWGSLRLTPVMDSSWLLTGFETPLQSWKVGCLTEDWVWVEWDYSWYSRRSGGMEDYSIGCSCGKYNMLVTGLNRCLCVVHDCIHFSQVEARVCYKWTLGRGVTTFVLDSSKSRLTCSHLSMWRSQVAEDAQAQYWCIHLVSRDPPLPLAIFMFWTCSNTPWPYSHSSSMDTINSGMATPGHPWAHAQITFHTAEKWAACSSFNVAFMWLEHWKQGNR